MSLDDSADVARIPSDMFNASPKAGAPDSPVVRATDLAGVHILKSGDTMLLSDSRGDVHPDQHGLGLFVGDTRFLSTYALLLNGSHPVLLRAGSAAAPHTLIHLANADLPAQENDVGGEGIVLPRNSLGVVRDRTAAAGLIERVTVTNYTTQPQRLRLTLTFDADFADIFEVRGFVREQRGERLVNEWSSDGPVFSYRGVDGVVRRTVVGLSSHMQRVTSSVPDAAPDTASVVLELDRLLQPGGSETVAVEVRSETLDGGPVEAPPPPWPRGGTIGTGHFLTDRALERSASDIELLLNDGPAAGERYVAAGVPWFSCLFGRDSIITSLQLLATRPEIARATLSILARLQATRVDELRDAAPGKILHELRTGELARTGEIPHTPYYGSADATPLWLMLLDEYERWTADSRLIDTLWPNVLAALDWLDHFGDLDGDGFIEYQRHSERGLVNQGWKDSADSVRNRDGTIASGPIALVEVQGYAYAARRGIARLARLRGDGSLSERLDRAADRLRERFEDAFWMESHGTYAMALDGAKKQVDGLASNAGHALWTGIASAERAARTTRTLTSGGMWSGWGIRTLSADMVGYNPIGYHVGSIWAHDNAICAAGFARYGHMDAAQQVAGAMFEAAPHFDEARMPELFGGFDRALSPLPVPYPVACSPQAWAAGSLNHLVSTMLGLRADARAGRLELIRPALPTWLPELRLAGLRVGAAQADLQIAAREGSISLEVLDRTGDLDVDLCR